MHEATVVVPTYEHGPTLRHAVRSALAQTVSDIEVLIVGDGVTPRTRDAVEDLMRSDERVRFEDHQKSPGHGFAYRHAAVESARSEVVLYLSDDDLWFPEHAEGMCELLREADFAVALTISVREKGPTIKHTTNLELPSYRKRIRDEKATLPFSATGHTVAGYRKLPRGWRVDDPDYKAFWRQFVVEPEVRAASMKLPTVLQFTSPPRAAMSLDERAAELARWSEILRQPAKRLELIEEVLALEIARSASLVDLRWRLREKRRRRPRKADEGR